jgi:hypothetical protein
MPVSTETRIEQLCVWIRARARERFSQGTEAELRELACELRAAIELHVKSAKSSLTTKKAAIIQRDRDERHDL